MFLKLRNESNELKLLRYLHSRMELSDEETRNYLNLEKGFKGELAFDVWLEKLSCDCLILNDLLFESNNTFFQIDSLLIQDTIYLFEVKNYEGDFYVDGDRWYTASKAEIKNPLDQLKRCESLLRQFLQRIGINFPIEAYLVFINPEFYLYQAPLNSPIIFPTQINRFMNKLNIKPFKLKDRHSKFANQLAAKHIKDFPYTRIPEYSYGKLEKGVTCAQCYSFISDFQEGKLVCNECGCKEDFQTAVIRSVEEYRFLFPDRRITTNGIHEWCRAIKSKKIIWNILAKNYKVKGYGKYSYYVSK